ncbi:MAG: hypothetical protein P0S95_03305 [Rhabdochlamydiaceae bacterium]|nr:hypothetical protein [Candidatus Amphrikana amoebophyrae]
MNWFIRQVLSVEAILLMLMFFCGAFCGWYLNRKKRKREKKLDYLDKILTRLVSERIDDFDLYVPKKLIKLSLVVPAMEKISETINTPFWHFFRNKILHDRLKDEIDNGFESKDWGETNYAVRAITMAPKIEYEKRVLNYLIHSNSVLCFAAATCAMNFKTIRSIEAILVSMENLDKSMQYLFRDTLLGADSDVFDILRVIFKRSDNEITKQRAFSILSLKMGYLEFEDIKSYFYHDNERMRWLALRAIENYPTHEGALHIIKCLKDPSWKVRALSGFLIGSLNLELGLLALNKGMHDEHRWVQFICALCLKTFGELGDDLLQANHHLEVVKYVEAMPQNSFTKGFRHFFPINQDPDILFESFTYTEQEKPKESLSF